MEKIFNIFITLAPCKLIIDTCSVLFNLVFLMIFFVDDLVCSRLSCSSLKGSMVKQFMLWWMYNASLILTCVTGVFIVIAFTLVYLSRIYFCYDNYYLVSFNK